MTELPIKQHDKHLFDVVSPKKDCGLLTPLCASPDVRLPSLKGRATNISAIGINVSHNTHASGKVFAYTL